MKEALLHLLAANDRAHMNMTWLLAFALRLKRFWI